MTPRIPQKEDTLVSTKINIMDTISYDKLLLKTAFCCMACDGHIDNREVDLIRSLCATSPVFAKFNFEEEINSLVARINIGSKDFIKRYFELLHNANLSEKEELTLVDFAIQTIKADEQVEYSEVKFFKAIRSRLKVSNEKIIELHPETEYYLEDEIVNDSYLDKIVNQYFETVELPQFGHLEIEGE